MEIGEIQLDFLAENGKIRKIKVKSLKEKNTTEANEALRLIKDFKY